MTWPGQHWSRVITCPVLISTDPGGAPPCCSQHPAPSDNEVQQGGGQWGRGEHCVLLCRQEWEEYKMKLIFCIPKIPPSFHDVSKVDDIALKNKKYPFSASHHINVMQNIVINPLVV